MSCNSPDGSVGGEGPCSMHKFMIFDEDVHPLQGSSGYSYTTPDTVYVGGGFRDDDEVEPLTKPLLLPSGHWTVLPAVEKCDNCRLPQPPFTASVDNYTRRVREAEDSQQEFLVPFYVSKKDRQPIGFLRDKVVQALVEDNKKVEEKFRMQPCWEILYTVGGGGREDASKSKSNGDGGAASNDANGSSDGTHDSSPSSSKKIWAVSIAEWLNEEGRDARSEHMDRLVRGWHQQGLFPEELRGWRNEHYAIYGPPIPQDDPHFSPLPGNNVAFHLERAACSLFSFITFGIHLNAYVVDKLGRYRVWVPRRSKNKQTWPGYLDNSVAGGITAGDSPLESTIRECAEEASLPPAFVRKNVRAAGAITYIYQGTHGWIQPETQYVYDLPMPEPPASMGTTISADEASASPRAELVTSIDELDETRTKGDGAQGDDIAEGPYICKPNDGEAESFTLMPVQEVVERILKDEFKPNCALVLIDFFIRHGLITAESDARFLEICQRLKRSLAPLPGPA